MLALTLLLLILTTLNAVVTLALVRQVGVLHLRIRPVMSVSGGKVGPDPGSHFAVRGISWTGDMVERRLFVLVGPTCDLCKPLIPGLHRLTGVPVTLVVVASPEDSRIYVRKMRSTIEYISDDGVLERNAIAGTPFAVVTDGLGTVLRTGGLNTLEQIEMLVEEPLVAQPRDVTSDSHTKVEA